MSGTVIASTPWSRTALRNFAHQYPDELAAIEEAIPDGHYIVFGAARRPGDWTMVLMREDDQAPTREVARAVHQTTIQSGCYAAIHAGKVAANA